MNTVIYAYSGTYLNNLKRIESVLGRDLVDLTNSVLKIGNEMFAMGFRYESGVKDYYREKVSESCEECNILEELKKKAAEEFKQREECKLTEDAAKDELDAQEITKDAIDKEECKDGEVTKLQDEIENDTVLEANDLDAQEITKDSFEDLENDLEDEDDELDEFLKQIDDDMVLD